MQKTHLIATWAFLASLFCLACAPANSVHVLTGKAWGTTYQIKIVAPDSDFVESEVTAALQKTLTEIDDHLSNWNPESEVSRFNTKSTGEPVRISPTLNGLMTTSNRVHIQSEGYLDLTLAPIIELWGFGAAGGDEALRPVQPDDEAIAAALKRVGQQRVLQHDPEAATLRKAQPETTVFLSALAKGAGIDAIHEVLSKLGYDNHLIEVGGDLIAVGAGPAGNGWQIAIEQPVSGDREAREVIALEDLAMATSGDYRNYFEQDGIRFSHIIDPHSGQPITHRTASVTVLSEKAVLADAWATALLAAGEERGLKIAERENIAALFISRSDRNGTTEFENAQSSSFGRLRNKP